MTVLVLGGRRRDSGGGLENEGGMGDSRLGVEAEGFRGITDLLGFSESG